MWKYILLGLLMVVLLLGPPRNSRKPKKRGRRKVKREADYFNPSGPIPPMGLGL